MLDSLQASRPFNPKLFEAYLHEFHLCWTSAVKSFWKSPASSSHVPSPDQTADALELANLLSEQLALVSDYGLEDARYKKAISALMGVSMHQSIASIKAACRATLSTMRNEYYAEQKVYLTSGPKDVFDQLKIVLENYTLCPKPDFLRSLITLASE